MGKLFKRGYSAVEEEAQRQKEIQEQNGKKLWRFFLAKDKDEADVRFLTEEPINFYEHTVKTMQGGKERYSNVICTRDLDGGCNLCDTGSRPSFKGAYLIYDKREYEYKDNNGKTQKGKGQLRLYIQGAKVLSQLGRLSERYGLTNRDYTIARSGSGTSTTYMFDRGDESKLTQEEITNMLPEKLRDQFDGTADSLYAILQDQLEMLINDSVTPVEESDDEENTTAKNLVNIDDEEEKPVHTSHSLKKPMKLGKKPAENSVKKLLNKKRK